MPCAAPRAGHPRATLHGGGRPGEETYSTVRFPVQEKNWSSVIAVSMVALDITEQIGTQRDLEELTQTLESKVAERTERRSRPLACGGKPAAPRRVLANMSP